MRLIGDWRGERGMEVGGEGDYIPIATLSPSAILMFHNCERQMSQDSVHRRQLLMRKVSRSRFEPRSFSVVLTSLNNAVPLGQTGSPPISAFLVLVNNWKQSFAISSRPVSELPCSSSAKLGMRLSIMSLHAAGDVHTCATYYYCRRGEGECWKLPVSLQTFLSA